MSLDYLNKNSHGIVFGNSCYYFFLEGGHRGNVGVGVGVGVGDCDGVSDHETRRVQRAPVVASSRSDVVCYAVCTWYAYGIIFSLSQTNKHTHTHTHVARSTQNAPIGANGIPESAEDAKAEEKSKWGTSDFRSPSPLTLKCAVLFAMLGHVEPPEHGTVLLVSGGVAVGVAQLVIFAYIIVAYYEGQMSKTDVEGHELAEDDGASDEGKKDK